MRNNFPKDAETTKLLGITREDENVILNQIGF